MTETSAPPTDDSRERALDELLRARECAAEPIRTLGRVQSYGMLFGIDESSGRVVMASSNASEWLGRDLREASDDLLIWALSEGIAVDPVRGRFDGQMCDVIVHRGTSPLIVELEPVVPGLDYVRTGVVSALQRLAGITDPHEVRQAAAREIKQITGYDRVMCYEFHADGHGTVVADEREPDMEPYLGLRFPASDIPAQARALYIEKRSRVIADTDDPGLTLHTVLDPAPAFDLGLSELRSASPHHLQFMRNMGQAATVSFALVADDRLVGMFTCAHRAPRRIPVLLRRAIEVMASQVAAQLSAAEQIRDLQRQLAARQRRAAITAPLYGRADPGELLMTGRHTVLDVVPADGAILRMGGQTRTVGFVPDPAPLLVALDALAEDALVSEALASEHPALAAVAPDVAGLITVPLGDGGDRLVFVRGEAARSVDWLGDQRAANRDQPLSPRRSFSSWREEVRGRSMPWGEHARDAFDLGDDIRGALAARAQAQLAELAWRDALTGLHNRRFLDDRLSGLLQGAATDVGIIFVDLDRFKQINDNHGHEVGDAVLAKVGKRLSKVVRESDAAVRLGGDEFVIVCADVSEEELQAIATRALEVIAEPVEVDGLVLWVTASAGVRRAGAGAGAAEILSAADAAMYRAKRSGGGRASA